MICTTQEQANEIALAGAAKMAGQNYQAVQSVMNSNVWKVIKGDGKFYRVEIGRMPRVCGCRFYRNNLRFRTCKHIVFCEAEAEALSFCATLAAPAAPLAQTPDIYSAFKPSASSVSAFAR